MDATTIVPRFCSRNVYRSVLVRRLSVGLTLQPAREQMFLQVSRRLSLPLARTGTGTAAASSLSQPHPLARSVLTTHQELLPPSRLLPP